MINYKLTLVWIHVLNRVVVLRSENIFLVLSLVAIRKHLFYFTILNVLFDPSLYRTNNINCCSLFLLMHSMCIHSQLNILKGWDKLVLCCLSSNNLRIDAYFRKMFSLIVYLILSEKVRLN